jgi:phosphate:Na+ symporter
LRIGDVIEQMLNGMLTVLRTNDRALAERLRKMDDIVDDLYTAVKLYLTQISREALGQTKDAAGRISSFTINMEQVGDTSSGSSPTSRTRRSIRAAASPRPGWPRSATSTRA